MPIMSLPLPVHPLKSLLSKSLLQSMSCQRASASLTATMYTSRRFLSRKSKPRPNGQRLSGHDGWQDSYHDDRSDNSDTERKELKNVLVLGSQGILGQTLITHFEACNWNVLGADIHKKEALNYVALPHEGSTANLAITLFRGVSQHLSSFRGKRKKLDAIVCAAGGWRGDVDIEEVATSATDKRTHVDSWEEQYLTEAADVVDKMMKLNYYPIVAGSLVGQRLLTSGGMFVIIGASAALSPTPGMIAYGSAKSAAHHYLQTFGSDHVNESISCVGILPLMLDTPANRAGVSEEDDRYSKMVKPIHIAKEIGEWIQNPLLRPHSGSLVKVIAKNKKDGSGEPAFHLVR